MSSAAPSPGRGRDLACVLLLVAASAALFLPAMRPGFHFLSLSPSVVPPWRGAEGPRGASDAAASDALIYTWPNLVHWRESVRGDWSGLLWNPWILCGTPFLATQGTFALYPSSLLALAGGLPFFLLWSSLLHVALANVGAYCALRRTGLSRPACAIGAWTFGAGGWFLAHLDVINFVQAAAWLPWILLFLDRALVEGRARDRVLLAACLALSILAGMVQITLLSLLLAVVFGRLRAEERARAGAPPATRRVLAAAAAVLAGVMLAGPQLVPLVDWSLESSRVRTPAEDVRRFAYRPLEWLGLLVPEVLGSPAELSRWTEVPPAGAPGAPMLPPTPEAAYPPARAAGARGPGGTFLESVCSPLAAGVLLALVALARPRGAALFFLLLAAAGAALAMDTPLMRSVAAAPMAAFANPRRFLLLCAVGFAGLCAAGAERLVVDRRRHLVALLPAALLGGWFALNRFFPGVIADSLRALTGDPLSDRVPAVLARQALVPAAVFALGGAVVQLRRAGAWRVAALGALAAADAFLFNARNNPARPAEAIFPETEVTRFVAERARDPLPPRDGVPVRYEDAGGPLTRIARFRSADPEVPPPVPPNVGLVFGFRDQQGYEGILPRRLEELLGAIQPGIVYEHHTVAQWPDASVFARPCFDLLGVRHVLSADHEVPNLYTLRQFPSETCSVFGNADFVPRVTVVTRARAFATTDELLRALAAPGFDPAREVLLLRSDLAALGLPEPSAGGVVELGAPAAGESVHWTQLSCGSARVEATLAAARLLVVSESFHRGWTARDAGGRPLPMAPANHAFQVIALPAGHVRAQVSFEPGSLRLGVLFAALGALALLADIIQRRRAARPARI